jgi:hypothetical protein
MPEQASGLVGATTQASFESPKRVEVNQVSNGFTVALVGGKVEKPLPFRNNLYIAQTVEQVVGLIGGHLSDK